MNTTAIHSERCPQTFTTRELAQNHCVQALDWRELLEAYYCEKCKRYHVRKVES